MSKKVTGRDLTAKQCLFVTHYLSCLNATEAALKAGYSEKNANKMGPELLGNTRIRDAIATQQAAREARTLITAEKILMDIDAIRANAMRLDDDGNMVDKNAAIKACELLGKHQKLFSDRIEHSGVDGKPLFHKIQIALVKPKNESNA